ncbi:MAG: hypothetical protein JNL22_11430 [Bacteroidales bacterium]|nr:hypothetical protein [Bacteroidales bacterium]
MEDQILGIGSRVEHPQFGKGVIIQVRTDAWEITFIENGTRIIQRDFKGLRVMEAVETPSDIATYEKMEKSLIRVLRRFTDLQETIPMGQRWTGGRMVLFPGDPSLKEKEIPIDAFFHKIVMVRDRLRVLEQRVNASALSDEDKVNIQQYITRIYGSLTTFNVLFKEKSDYFIGEKGE